MFRAVLFTCVFATSIVCNDALNNSEVYSLITHVEGQYLAPGSAPRPPPPRPANVPSNIGVYPRGLPYSLFIPEQMQEAMDTVDYLLKNPNGDDFVKMCTGVRNASNEELYTYAYTMALLLRNDTCNIQMPPISETMPLWYFPKRVLDNARDQVLAAPDEQTRVVVDYEFEVIDGGRDPENCLAYFREDLLMNSHHWNWHLIYPNNQVPAPNQLRDRQGELFYFMHQQAVRARYETERISCNLPPTIPFDQFRQPILENYAPTLLSSVSGNEYPARPENLVLQDVPDRNITIDLLNTWFQRIFQAIDALRVTRNDSTVIQLTEPQGIDVLGAIVEASARSVNQAFYGNGHNRMHTAIARITTASEQGGLQGVMGFSTTSMRDPIFFRWHTFIDNVFATYKSKVQVYSYNDFNFPDVTVLDIHVNTIGLNDNVLVTYFEQREVFVSNGVDFTRRNPVFVRVNHLQHAPFTHNIYVDNRAGRDVSVTVRIYIAPTKGHTGRSLSWNDQRRMYIHLDTFKTTVKPGRQMIVRRSEDSSVTTPTPQSFNELGRPSNSSNISNETRASCGCGWPDSLALPRGTPSGQEFDYFVMLTAGSDYNEGEACCKTAPSYCGILNQPYPDRRSMGFPFDRPFPRYVSDIYNFTDTFLNSWARHIYIRHQSDKK